MGAWFSAVETRRFNFISGGLINFLVFAQQSKAERGYRFQFFREGEHACLIGKDIVRKTAMSQVLQKKGNVMSRGYLAFDIETAKEVPGEDFNWRPHRPLGISCAAAFPQDAKEPIVWYGKNSDGTPAQRMSQEETGNVVRELVDRVAHGYTLLTWNGLGFDFDVLAEESGCYRECRELAFNHVDMMFHVFCDRGYPVKLDKAAQGLGIPGKPPGMSGLLAPQLWAQGRYQDVLNYVIQDVRIALQVATKCEAKRRFEWITRRGSSSSMDLPRGWLAVRDALRLPEPDTSWMDNPTPRHEFTQWLKMS